MPWPGLGNTKSTGQTGSEDETPHEIGEPAPSKPKRSLSLIEIHYFHEKPSKSMMFKRGSINLCAFHGPSLSAIKGREYS